MQVSQLRPNNESATGVLRDEHQTILQVMVVFEQILRDSPDKSPQPLKKIEDCLTFFYCFADLCHHGKEEDILFPELEAHGFSTETGPIAVMRHEHILARNLINCMKDYLAKTKEGDTSVFGNLKQAGFAFVELMNQHIAKEDQCLFGMVEQTLGDGSCKKLCQKYGKVCASRFKGRSKKDLYDLADRIMS